MGLGDSGLSRHRLGDALAARIQPVLDRGDSLDPLADQNGQSSALNRNSGVVLVWLPVIGSGATQGD